MSLEAQVIEHKCKTEPVMPGEYLKYTVRTIDKRTWIIEIPEANNTGAVLYCPYCGDKLVDTTGYVLQKAP